MKCAWEGVNTLPIPDEQLMAGWRGGDEGAFAELYERYRHQVMAYIARLVWDRHLAEDCFQETFYRVFAHGGTYDSGRPFRPWLFRIATNVCRTCRSRHTPLAEAAVNAAATGVRPGDAEQPDRAADQATADEIRAALLALTIDQRAVVVLHHFHGLSYLEVAQVLDIPPGTVKSRMNAALTALRRNLGPQPGPLTPVPGTTRRWPDDTATRD